MRMSEPDSGRCAPKMILLDRAWRAAWLHGYRVGLQVGEHGYSVMTVRDPLEQRSVIAIIGKSIDDAAVQLLDRMLREEWVTAETVERL